MRSLLLFAALACFGNCSWSGGATSLRDTRPSAPGGKLDSASAVARGVLQLRAKGVARLRGGGYHDLPEPDVNLVPPKYPPPESFREHCRDREGEASLAAAESALAEGRFDEARRLHQVAARRFTEQWVVSLYIIQLDALEASIDATEEALRLAAELALIPPVVVQPPPFWSISQHLNLTEPQVQALEGWTGRRLTADKLLYLASCDGFESRKFHKLCDRKGPTLTLVRTDTGHIFGGYTCVPWSKGELTTLPPRWNRAFHHDESSFVFRLTSPKGTSRRKEEAREKRDRAKDKLDLLGVTKEEFDNYTLKCDTIAESLKWCLEGTNLPRWCLDVEVEGLSNSTVAIEGPQIVSLDHDVAMADDIPADNNTAPPHRLAVSAADTEAMADEEGVSPGAGAAGSSANGTNATVQEWTEPVRLRYVGRDPDVPPVRHAWCMGPCWTHALEIDLDCPEKSFSDLLSGAIFEMPPGVPDEDERLWMSGKIGGRFSIEEIAEETRWEILEVAVFSI
ncbi:hypothetical protein T484DRAFT_1956397 [Baffinella frigidus]|nr:hypothetical protein T484DRAFT_1956397 [Cryptophyta sp. CCMP2293]